jgi:hypothetical protein
MIVSLLVEMAISCTFVICDLCKIYAQLESESLAF